MRALFASAALALGAASSAFGAPIEYALVSGSVTLTVDEYSPSSGRIHRAADPVKVDLASALLVVDAEQGTVNLAFAASPFVEFALRPGTPGYEYDGYRTLVLESFEVQALGGSLVAQGGGFSFAGADIGASFGASGIGGSFSGQSSPSLMPGSLAPGPIYGDLGSGGPLSVAGTAVGLFASPFNGSELVVTGSFVVKAAGAADPVPEPDALLLFLAGLTVAAATAGRSRTGRAAGRAPGS